MEEQKKGAEKWIDGMSDLVETYRDLITIKVVEQTSLGATVSILGLILLVVIVFVLLFLGVGAAWWVGESMGNMKAGFFIISGLYAVLLIALLLSARKILIPGIRNLIIKKIYEQD
jgi:hypothetical protein